MARTNFANLRSDTISLKKYFYTLRVLLAVRWIETYGEPPPIEVTVHGVAGRAGAEVAMGCRGKRSNPAAS